MTPSWHFPKSVDTSTIVFVQPYYHLKTKRRKRIFQKKNYFLSPTIKFRFLLNFCVSLNNCYKKRRVIDLIVHFQSFIFCWYCQGWWNIWWLGSPQFNWRNKEQFKLRSFCFWNVAGACPKRPEKFPNHPSWNWLCKQVWHHLECHSSTC